MRLSGLVHINRARVKEIAGRHYISFWDESSLICLEDEMIYDANADDYYLPRYELKNGRIESLGRGQICL